MKSSENSSQVSLPHSELVARVREALDFSIATGHGYSYSGREKGLAALDGLFEQLEALQRVADAARSEMEMMVVAPRGKFPPEDELRDALAALNPAKERDV